MLYTCSVSVAKKKTGKMRCYYIIPNHGNDVVVPDKSDMDLYKSGIMTPKGFALNYETKLRRSVAYEWMTQVSAEASHEDVVLIGEEKGSEKSYLIILAEMMTSMFGGKMNFRYGGEIK